MPSWLLEIWGLQPCSGPLCKEDLTNGGDLQQYFTGVYLQFAAPCWSMGRGSKQAKGKQGLVTALTHLYSLCNGQETVLPWNSFSKANLAFFHFREQRKLPKDAVLAAVQGLGQKRRVVLVWQPCFKGAVKIQTHSCLGSELIVLQIHKFCVRRGISTEIWVPLPKSASHWRAEKRDCYFFASLCSFQLAPLSKGVLLIRKPSQPEKVYYSLFPLHVCVL